MYIPLLFSSPTDKLGESSAPSTSSETVLRQLTIRVDHLPRGNPETQTARWNLRSKQNLKAATPPPPSPAPCRGPPGLIHGIDDPDDLSACPCNDDRFLLGILRTGRQICRKEAAGATHGPPALTSHLMGESERDIELKYTPSNLAIAASRYAVNRDGRLQRVKRRRKSLHEC